MNVLMQTCGLVIVLFLFILFKSHKTLHLPSEHDFLWLMIVSMICLSLDILSVVAIYFKENIDVTLLHLICKAYVISLPWVGVINFAYVCIDLNSNVKNHRQLVRILSCFTLAVSILMLCLPIDVHDNGTEVYTAGPAVIASYAFTLFYILSTLTVSIYISKKSSQRRGFAVIITTCIWILAAAVQSVKNELLLVGFSQAIGIMILYIVLENPDGKLDKRLNCFNSNAFHEYIETRFKIADDFGLIAVSFVESNDFVNKNILEEAHLKKIISNISTRKGLFLFKNDFSNIVIVAEDEKMLDDIARDVVEMGREANIGEKDANVFVISSVKQFMSANELYNFIGYMRSNHVARLSTVIHVSDDMIDSYREIGIIKNEIDEAIKDERVEVFMQPIYNNATGKITSAEALVRIRKPDGSYLSPAIFIPVAETTGQIMELGEIVLEKVCAFIKENDMEKLGLTSIDVNLSAVQCDSSNMAGRICRIVDSYEIDTGFISFEITETAVSQAKDTLLENMDALVSRGFNFALDDFGKGESNLIYIVEMPVKFIKLDIEMSKAYFASQKAKDVIGAIADMAQRLGLPIVAEGIENEEEANGISKEGIQYIQGYYYSRPLPMYEFVEFINQFGSSGTLPEPAPLNDADKTDEPDCSFDPDDFKGCRVLLTDDNELNREIAQEILEDFEMIVDTADDGTAAVEKMMNAAAGDYDFILMDIKMPIMDGFEATRRIRALPDKAVAGTPVIALTAYTDDESKQFAEAAGMDAITAKPIDIGKIMGLVTEIKEKKNSEVPM